MVDDINPFNGPQFKSKEAGAKGLSESLFHRLFKKDNKSSVNLKRQYRFNQEIMGLVNTACKGMKIEKGSSQIQD